MTWIKSRNHTSGVKIDFRHVTPAEINQFNFVLRKILSFLIHALNMHYFLNQQFFDFLLNGDDLRLDLRSLVLGYTSGDDWSANTTGTSKSCKDKFLKKSNRCVDYPSLMRRYYSSVSGVRIYINANNNARFPS